MNETKTHVFEAVVQDVCRGYIHVYICMYVFIYVSKIRVFEAMVKDVCVGYMYVCKCVRVYMCQHIHVYTYVFVNICQYTYTHSTRTNIYICNVHILCTQKWYKNSLVCKVSRKSLIFNIERVFIGKSSVIYRWYFSLVRCAHICTRTHVCTNLCQTHICTYAHTHIHTRTNPHIRTHAYVCVFIGILSSNSECT